ncbi:uncharacterized protein [Littorina saxatilis]|uniref:Uncharacterized protein n=1 Tax=Littorina saxatilis TaxID=31220 RepID=A0AAN9AJR8_9CAEN
MIPTVDLVRVGISVAVALLLCTLRLRLVLWTDTLFSIAAGGATFYYAKDILKQMCLGSAAVDAQHEFLVGTRCILLLMPAVTWLFCRTTVDITCRTALTLSRLVGYLGAAIVMGVDHYRLKTFSDFHLMYCLLPCCLWSLVMAVQLIRTGSRVNIHIRRVDINKFLLMDLLLLLLLSLTELIAPAFVGQFVDRSVDPLHAYLHRINGCIFLGLAVIPWIGQRFRYSEDKHTVLISRVLCSLIWFGAVGFGINIKQFPLNLSMYMFMGQMGVLFLPAFLGNLVCQSGPLTGAFWSSNRKAVQINQQGQQASPRR